MPLRLRLPLDLALDPLSAPHDYLLGEGLLAELGRLAAGVPGIAPGPCALVTDTGVAATPLAAAAEASLRAAGFAPEVVVVPPGDAAKTVAEAEILWARLAEGGVERGGAVVALGGGAVGDLAGFCAATWQRGVAVVQVPTTLLAMADSSVGGKTGINLAAGKNLVGAFHLPALVVADLGALDTLPDREYRAGFAEVVKCAVLAERPRLAALREGAPALLARSRAETAEAVSMAVQVKAHHVRGDLRDVAGVRALLNLGHTVGHALEAEAGFEGLLHGEAVAIGLVVAARLAAARGIAPGELVDGIAGTLAAFHLPGAPPAGADVAALVARTRFDKKRAAGRRRMVLPLAEGGAALFDVDDSELLAALCAS